MIIVDETHLTLFDKYIRIYRDQTVLILSKSREIFQEHIKIDIRNRKK